MLGLDVTVEVKLVSRRLMASLSPSGVQSVYPTPRLHYTTLHYTTLHYTTLHYTTLHYTTLHFTTLHYTRPYLVSSPRFTRIIDEPLVLANAGQCWLMLANAGQCWHPLTLPPTYTSTSKIRKCQDQEQEEPKVCQPISRIIN